MSDKQHKGQLQTVEGSAVGEFHVVPKFAYNATLQVEYLGEAKVGLSDRVNGHYIQKFIYDSTLNLKRILIATNKATAGCTEVTVAPLAPNKVRLTAHNGDFGECERPTKGGTAKKKPSELTTLNLNTGTQTIVGRVIEINTDASEVVVELNNEDGGLTNENNTIISETSLFLLFNSENKPYEKRRWTNRKRYFYDTPENT